MREVRECSPFILLRLWLNHLYPKALFQAALNPKAGVATGED